MGASFVPVFRLAGVESHRLDPRNLSDRSGPPDARPNEAWKRAVVRDISPGDRQKGVESISEWDTDTVPVNAGDEEMGRGFVHPRPIEQGADTDADPLARFAVTGRAVDRVHLGLQLERIERRGIRWEHEIQGAAHENALHRWNTGR